MLKQNYRINSLLNLKETANDSMDSLKKTVNEASDNLEKSREAFAKLGIENESMKDIKSSVESAIKKETLVLEELQKGLDKAKNHSTQLKTQVRLFYFQCTGYYYYFSFKKL